MWLAIDGPDNSQVPWSFAMIYLSKITRGAYPKNNKQTKKAMIILAGWPKIVIISPWKRVMPLIEKK